MKVLVTRSLPGNFVGELKKKFDVELNGEDRVLKREELLQRVKGKDALLCLLTDKIDAQVMDAAGKQLKIISNYAVGYDNVDVKAATERGILVTNTPGVLTETVADLTMGLLLDSARRITESDKYMRDGKYKGWAPSLFLGYDVYGKTLGIIGMGRIGLAVAKRAHKGFGIKIIYEEKMGNVKQADEELQARRVDLETLLRESDFVSIHVPLMKENVHLIGEKEFRMMKRNAIIINTSRGPIIDEAALVKALKEKVIGGAALDVFEKEPEMAAGLAELGNAVVVPHIGSASVETRGKMAQMACSAIIEFFAGKIPENVVNREVLQKLGK